MLNNNFRDLEFFVKFINLLMNDTTYIFDESLSALIEIRNVQNIKNDAAAWNALTAVNLYSFLILFFIF